MSSRTYRQCVLTKQLGNDEYDTMCYSTRTAWIPSKFAVVGKVLRLGDDDGWTVAAAGKDAMSEEFVMQRRDDYRYQRRVSDV